MVIFNEANVCNLLETIMFGELACENLEEAAIDLLDYAIRHLTQIASGEIVPNHNSFTSKVSNWTPGQDLPDIPIETIDEELKRLQDEVGFQIAMKCLSIVRYMTDHMESMILGVTTRMTMTHDVPILLAQLIEMKPWMHVSGGKTKVFHGSEWITMEDETELPKLEAQAWIALYNLLSKKASKDKYELHHYRLNVITKLSGQINEVISNQLPILANLKEWLLRLNVAASDVATSAPARDLVMIEAVAEIHDSLEQRYRDKYDEIAENQKNEFLGATSEAWQKEAGRILETLDSEAAQSLMQSQKQQLSSNSNVCAQCHDPAPKQRCSRCKTARYCSRECQTKHWPRHKGRCTTAG